MLKVNYAGWGAARAVFAGLTGSCPGRCIVELTVSVICIAKNYLLPTMVEVHRLDRVPAGSSYILTLHALGHSFPQPAAGPLLYLDGTYHRL